MKHLLTLIFIGLTSLYAQTIPSYVPTSGLVGWWPFSGNANDESGNGNNGTVNGATLSIDRFGNAGSCFEFNGDPNVFISTNYYGILGNNPRTISFWAILDNTNDMTAVSYGSNNNGQRFTCGFNYPSSGVTASIAQASATYGASTSLNGWNHFVFVYSSTFGSNVTSIMVYQNGQLLSNLINVGFSNITLNTTSGFPLSIGKNFNTAFQAPFDGKLDDFGFWNRALAPSEIEVLFLSCNDSLQSQPIDFTAYASTGWANFKCKSTDTAATFQWQQSSGAGWIDLTNLGNYSGATSDSLVITGVTSSMNNYGYRCIVASCTTDTSDVAVLTVTNGIGLGESKLDKLTISPNPTNGFISLNTVVLGTYELLTLDGRILESGTAKKEYDLSVYPKGVYHLRLSTDEGTRVLKVVKN